MVRPLENAAILYNDSTESRLFGSEMGNTIKIVVFAAEYLLLSDFSLNLAP